MDCCPYSIPPPPSRDQHDALFFSFQYQYLSVEIWIPYHQLAKAHHALLAPNESWRTPDVAFCLQPLIKALQDPRVCDAIAPIRSMHHMTVRDHIHDSAVAPWYESGHPHTTRTPQPAKGWLQEPTASDYRPIGDSSWKLELPRCRHLVMARITGQQVKHAW